MIQPIIGRCYIYSINVFNKLLLFWFKSAERWAALWNITPIFSWKLWLQFWERIKYAQARVVVSCIFFAALQLCADTVARSRTKRKPLNDASLEKGIIFCHPLVCVFYVNKTNGWQVFAGSRIKIYFMRAQWRREKRRAELESAQPSCAANTHKQKIAPPHITPLLTFSKHACAPLLAFGLMRFIYVLRNACMSLCRRLKCRRSWEKRRVNVFSSTTKRVFGTLSEAKSAGPRIAVILKLSAPGQVQNDSSSRVRIQAKLDTCTFRILYASSIVFDLKNSNEVFFININYWVNYATEISIKDYFALTKF